MTFPRKYCVEFWQPMRDPTSRKRVLVVASTHSRDYAPISSGAGLRFTVPDVVKDDVTVAMLAPPHWTHLVVWTEGALDFGRTILAVLANTRDSEFGVALGAYDGSLEMELVHALREKS